MKQSALHVAVIMDGNGRWATRRCMPRVVGHRAGALAVRRTVEAAAKLGVGTLTLYAFSSDNWRRPASEIDTLMTLFRDYLAREADECARRGVRVTVIGRRDRLPDDVRAAIEQAEAATAGGSALHLRIAVDYSARDSILAASARINGGPATRERFACLLADAMHAPQPAPDVDLLIRTSGEQRLSDFLLWECAYAELWFTDRLWPDFGEEDLRAALAAFTRRERRFGAVPAQNRFQPPSSPSRAS